MRSLTPMISFILCFRPEQLSAPVRAAVWIHHAARLFRAHAAVGSSSSSALGFRGERHGDFEAPLLAMRQRACIAIETIAQSDEMKDFAGLFDLRAHAALRPEVEAAAHTCRAMRTLSSTVSCGKTLVIWKGILRPRAA